MVKIKLIKRQECVRLTWTGRILVLLILFVGLLIFFRQIPYFLSVNQPVHGKVLLLDGQMPDYAIVKAIEIFKAQNYELVITTGGQMPTGFYISDIKTMAELSMATFLKLGFPPDKIVALPTGNILRNRTYHSALTSKEWFNKNPAMVHKIDVLAIGCHARRSRYLFQKAMGNQFEIGIISVKDPAFELNSWWKSSIGSRAVISETIGYFYVKIFN
jgi:uncharacterized SAM-binding protein YcdF (DUF218 family)